jgi:sarcosine oxidase subunit alpha
MPEDVTILCDGRPVHTNNSTTVAAALLNAGITNFRRSVTGEPRGPVCGMGVCFECCLTIDGEPDQRSCQTLCRQGMEIETNGN